MDDILDYIRSENQPGDAAELGMVRDGQNTKVKVVLSTFPEVLADIQGWRR
jgi:hypothetical protein